MGIIPLNLLYSRLSLRFRLYTSFWLWRKIVSRWVFNFLYRKGNNPLWFVTLPNTKSLLVCECKISMIYPENVGHLFIRLRSNRTLYIQLNMWQKTITRLDIQMISTIGIFLFGDGWRGDGVLLRGDNSALPDCVSQHGGWDYASHFS